MEERGRGGDREIVHVRRGVFLAMHVLEIPAGGRGFPLVCLMLAQLSIYQSEQL